jgi:predicted membrane protein
MTEPKVLLFNIFVIILFTLLWLAFFATLIFRREMLNNTWQQIRSLPLLIQLIL